MRIMMNQRISEFVLMKFHLRSDVNFMMQRGRLVKDAKLTMHGWMESVFQPIPLLL